MKNIEEMGDWEILNYLRSERKWMVQSHYTKDDIERDFCITINDWDQFTDYACDAFDHVKFEVMEAIVENYNEE